MIDVKKKPQGEIRQSQIIRTFGPGSMVDLPNHSVLISGLDFWMAGGDLISEPRLSQKLARVLSVPSVNLRTPPPADTDPTAPTTGIPVFQFPEWFITQDLEEQTKPGVRSRLLIHRKSLTRGKYWDRDKRKRSVVPVRFVRACRLGHIGDVDWYVFAHSGKSDCAKQQRQLYIDERGTSGDLTEVWIRCECGKAERSMAQAALLQNRAFGLCDGARPWLGPYTREQCGEPSRLLIRSASNAYFPQLMSVISLPDRDVMVKRAVDAIWGFLEAVESIDDLRYERKKATVKTALEGLGDEEVFAEIQSQKTGGAKPEKSVKVAELETLIAAKEEIGEDRPEGIFHARSMPSSVWDRPWMKPIEKVVLVHRLREVVAQVGFTRFEAAAADIEGELDIGVRRASLAREITWLPACENKGEGVFLQFNPTTIQAWIGRPAVVQRGLALAEGFKLWQSEHQGTKREFPGLPYMMLHSFSHLLISTVALECGYPASSIRERIYASPSVGYGVLLYTGSSDAEGTLGGLVEVGRRIHESVRNALDMGTLCSNDPVCAQHDPPSSHERRFLHGSACHGCLLISETSCEQQNDFLDRALVVRTVQNLGAEFFVEAVTSEGTTPFVSAV
jgi:MrfA Zn-binding domain